MRYVGLFIALMACGKSHPTGPRDGDVPDASIDATIFTDGPVRDVSVDDGSVPDVAVPPDVSPDVGSPDGGTVPYEEVDILLVIDNSSTMAEEQVRLIDGLNGLLRRISSGAIERDVHVGVVTTDMGAGESFVPTCEVTGDDGVLQSRSGCRNAFALVNRDMPGGVEEAACLADVGLGGCAFEQPLDAMLKALMPARHPVRFFDGTAGHGEGENAPFLREDSLLVVVLLTDEDDCSAQDRDLYNPASGRYPSPDLNLRCWMYPEALHPTMRFQQLQDLRPSGGFILAAIVGLPTDLAPGAGERPDYTSLVGPSADPRMEARVSPADPGVLASVCEEASAWAQPASRILRTMGDFDREGVPTVLGSICATSYHDTFDTLSRQVDAARR